MKAPAHIATGITFTGVICSIYDINIFESYTTTLLCAFCALLPDIDTTSTLLGKSVYPIAKFINRKFGHRTITHSLLFVLLVPLVPKVLIYFNIITNTTITMIATLSVLSHIILDMFTLAGVPFFYPFLKNSCVIPANPNFRFTVGDWKAEITVTGVCAILAFSMQPLFMNGFWTTYNRSFGTIRHVHRENNNTERYTLCDYSYIDNNITHEGTALVIESQINEITLFNRGEIFVLNTNDTRLKINYTRPRASGIPKEYQYIQFYGLTLDSIQTIMRQNLVTGLIQSSYNVEYIDKAITYNASLINIRNKYNFHITAITDTATAANSELAQLEAVQLEEQRRYSRRLAAYNSHINRISELEQILSGAHLSNYERNKHQNELISLRGRSIERPSFEPSLRTQVRIDELRRARSAPNLQFSGYLTIYKIVDPSLPEVRRQYREIEDHYLATATGNESVYNILKPQ